MSQSVSLLSVFAKSSHQEIQEIPNRPASGHKTLAVSHRRRHVGGHVVTETASTLRHRTHQRRRCFEKNLFYLEIICRQKTKLLKYYSKFRQHRRDWRIVTVETRVLREHKPPIQPRVNRANFRINPHYRQSFRQVWYKSAIDCMRNANKCPKIPYSSIAKKMKN